MWEAEHQKAFDKIKEYLTTPPVLIPPSPGRGLRLYVAAAEASIGAILAQVNDQGYEQAVYYLSKTLTCTEKRYSAIEKFRYVIYYSVHKLQHYFSNTTVSVISKSDLVKYMLSRPIARSRIGRWAFIVLGYALRHVP